MLQLKQSLGRISSLTEPGVLQSAAAREPTLCLEIIRDMVGLRMLASEWRDLMDRLADKASVYQSFDWAVACASRLETGSSLCILVAREGGRLVGIAPLMIERHIGLPRLRWLGGNLTIYGDVLADSSVDVSAWLHLALHEIAQRGEAQSLLLENVRADACIAQFLETESVEVSRQEAPWIDLADLGGFEAWRASLSRSTRRSRSRRLKKLEQAGTVGFVFERAGPGAAKWIAEVFAMKRDWATARGVISRTIGDPSFESLVGELVSTDSCLDARFSVLTLDEKAIAIELGFVSGGVYQSYLGAYDLEFEGYSPGALQLEKTIEACFAEGIEDFDLQPPADAYKMSFASRKSLVFTYSAALSSFGMIQAMMARADSKRLAKGVLDRMPVRYRRMVSPMMRRAGGRSGASANGSGRAAKSLFLRRGLPLLAAGAAIAVVMAE
jgi:CelD/BcsL family acetyltransferase involved in cellulose biosynthesis